ncbi:MAG: hypothetical protein WBA22_09315 [Candidatus Methanofastidiosia archaeon]
MKRGNVAQIGYITAVGKDKRYGGGDHPGPGGPHVMGFLHKHKIGKNLQPA